MPEEYGQRLTENVNTGFLFTEPKVGDYKAGELTGITYKVVNGSGNWIPYLPSEERQYGRFLDTMACVTFSALNCLETQLNYFIQTGAMPEAHMSFLRQQGYLEEGEQRVNLSDRFTAKMSGTTQKGNYLNAVAESIRKHGVLPERDWVFDRDKFDWAAYYAEIPQELKDKAQKFSEYFLVQWEWINGQPSISRDHIKQAPIQIATAVCPGWSDKNPVPSCNLEVQHATMITAVDQAFQQPTDIFDHYEPFKKRLALDYPIPWRLKYVVTFLKENDMNETVLRLNYKGKFGLMFLGRLGGNIVFASKPENYKKLGEMYGVKTVNDDGTFVATDVTIN